MNFRSYVGKVFLVESSKSIIRDAQFKEQRYQAGEDLPPGKQVGDVKTIPQRTEIKVTDVKADSGRHTFVFVVAANGDQSFGWTASMNGGRIQKRNCGTNHGTGNSAPPTPRYSSQQANSSSTVSRITLS